MQLFRSLLFILSFTFVGLLAADTKAATSSNERTLSIIKPDAVKANHIGDIISLFEQNGLKVVAISMRHISKKQAEEFYGVHKERPFFPSLVEFMSSGPIVAIVLEGNDAVSKNRALMGATDPKDADKGTIRAKFAKSKGENAVHGSDSAEAARQEIAFFFSPDQVFDH